VPPASGKVNTESSEEAIRHFKADHAA
jgi:hypothetical protein